MRSHNRFRPVGIRERLGNTRLRLRCNVTRSPEGPPNICAGSSAMSAGPSEPRVVLTIDESASEFNEKEWIGRGKIYKVQNLPGFVTAAHEKTLDIPDASGLCSLRPDRKLSVIEFLAFRMPRVSSEIIHTKTELWYSQDLPTMDGFKILSSRPVPSPSFVEELYQKHGQAWLDGAQSVVDHRVNDGSDRLPLWTIAYWKEVIDTERLQDQWAQSVSWLERESRLQRLSGDLSEKTFQLLSRMGWDNKMHYCNRTVSTLLLAKLLGTAWLNDEVIDTMIQQIHTEIDLMPEKDKPQPTIQITNLSFPAAIRNWSPAIHQSSKSGILHKFEKAAKDKTLEQLYYPVHVNGTHWIAGMVDFNEATPCDSLYDNGKGSGIPAKLIEFLQGWLKQAFGKRFKNQGNILPHAVQNDSFSCPIITVNTITHAVLNEPLWSAEDAKEARLKWFNRLASAHCNYQKEPIARLEASKDQESVLPPLRSEKLGLTFILNNYPQLPHSTVTYNDNQPDDSFYMSDESDDELQGNGFTPVVDDQTSTVNESVDGPSKSPATSPTLVTTPPSKLIGIKQLRKVSLSEEDGSESDSGNSHVSEDERRTKFIRAGEGTSHSAVASRKLRDSVSQGSFQANERRMLTWKEKILEGDDAAQFDPDKVRRVRHSKCRKWIIVKEPYDTVRWKDHLKGCKIKGKLQSLFTMGFSKVAKTKETTIVEEVRPPPPTQPQVPCPGISDVDNPKISRYLRRTGALGDGSRSLPVIAKQLFKKLFSRIVNEDHRKQVLDTQMHEQIEWR
ncbi:hypothetical protein D9613_012142 [Agrocybe pediades]|uniref:Ubiquitin-like protease family profile domain-containing protein n=1 Tax=Agrocybe pediades TaxID=84607 RepID=A0A8H4R3S6_9AGAR|nr:hypothetical protein D9613_012142 [Agrocybe pediades]